MKGRCIYMKQGQYYAVPLHMHSCFEGRASMGGHICQASRLGMEYMWITDHDFLMGKSKNWADGISFADGILEQVEPEEKTDEKMAAMFNLVMPFGTTIDAEKQKEINESLIENLKRRKSFQLKEDELHCMLSIDHNSRSQKCMKITAKGDETSGWKKSVIELAVAGERTQHSFKCSLLAGVSIQFPLELKGQVDDDVRITFCASMSQQIPDFKTAGIRYVIGNWEMGGHDPQPSLIPEIPLSFTNGDTVVLNLSDDAEKYVTGGLDNAFWRFWIEIELRNGRQLEAFIGDVKIERKYEYEEVLKRQRKLAAEIGRKYGVTPIVTNEITAAGQHKISFCTKVPVIDYSEGPKSHEFAVEWVKEHGGIFSLNHPFADWKRIPVKPEDKAVVIENLAQHYISHRCWGASMMEVGFPQGRENFEYQDYLTLWDKLSEAGIFITGYGDSDNHNNISNWLDGNNFCAFLYSEDPCEDSFVETMKCGNLYAGDPVQFKGELSFGTTEGTVMGQVIEISELDTEKTVCLNIHNAPEKATLVWVINGMRQVKAATGREVAECLRVPLKRTVNFVRAEMYMESGRCIMLTNPIYFVRKGSVEIPKERKVMPDKEKQV